MVTEQELDLLLAREDPNVEWKLNVADKVDVVRNLVAFANDFEQTSRRGVVICGIEESKDASGFKTARKIGLLANNFQEIQGFVEQACWKHVSPPLTIRISELSGSEATRRILVFEVDPSPHLHWFRNREETQFPVRIHSDVLNARGEVYAKLLRQKVAVRPFLENPCLGATMEDLDLPLARTFLTEAGLPRPADYYLKPGMTIEANSPPLVVEDGGEARPTYLAILCFGHEPSRFLPGAVVRVSRYPGVDKTSTSSQVVEALGALPDLIRRVLAELQPTLGIEIDKSQSAFAVAQNRRRYSEKAIQEALVNSVAHRDYMSPDPTRVTVYADRIEFWNPGGSRPGVDPRLFQAGEAPPQWPNPGLATLLQRMGLAQREGQGLPTILDETRRFSGREAQITPTLADFRVVIPAYQRNRQVEANAEDGLILVSIGGKSISAIVDQQREQLGLGSAQIVVDVNVPQFIEPAQWEAETIQLRDELKSWVDDPRIQRFHLFYRGPVVLAPLLGALIASAKPLYVYYYDNGSYGLAYVLDRRFLRG